MAERTFAIGGWLCVGAAVLFAVAIVGSGALAVAPEVLTTPVLFGVMGGLFLAVSRQARADRRSLLSTGASTDDAVRESGPR